MNIEPKNEQLITESVFVALDFETTGLNPQHSRVIEIGMARIIDGKIADTYTSLIYPAASVPYAITALTGITEEQLSQAPLFEDIALEIKKFLGDAIIIAHNASFDIGFLKKEFLRAGIEPPENPAVCTVKLAKRLLPELRSKSLNALKKHYKIIHKNAHRALPDAIVAAKVFLKMLPKLEEEFGIRNTAQLIKFQEISQKSLNFKFAKKSLAEDMASAPDSPGVYFFKDRNGKTIYIGKAKSLKKRIRSYFLATASKKAKKITRKAKHIEFKRTNTELTALLAETKLIKRYDPEFNSQLKNFPQTFFLKIETDKKFPRPKIVSQLRSDGADYFGPYRNRETAYDMLDVVNKAFLTRECTETEFRKKKICYLAEIGRCAAPCVYPDEKKYAEELARVYRFLSGENQDALVLLLNKMKSKADKKLFEEAAQLRDAVQTLLKQLKRAAILAEPVNSANALVEIKGSERNDYLLFLNGNFHIKYDITEEKNFFDVALDDYFSGAINYEEKISAETIEYFKIALAWLNSKRDLINIYYLKDFETKEELFRSVKGL